MSNYHYLDEAGKPQGPVTEAEIVKLADAAKKKGKQLLTAKPGASGWIPYGAPVPISAPAPAPAPAPATVVAPAPIRRPAQPVQPVQPAQPVQAAQPAQPAQATQAAQPAQVAQPVQPAQQPAQAPQPARPRPQAVAQAPAQVQQAAPAQVYAQAPAQTYAAPAQMSAQQQQGIQAAQQAYFYHHERRTPWVAVACYVVAGLHALAALGFGIVAIILIFFSVGATPTAAVGSSFAMAVLPALILALFFTWGGKVITLLDEIVASSRRR